MHTLFSLLIVCLPLGLIIAGEDCADLDTNCADWIAADQRLCGSTDYIEKSCRRACGVCRYLPKKFDISHLPASLKPVAFLVGIWRSEHGGKAIFPTIPKFTYGEEIQFSLADTHMHSSKALNYTAFAWGINQGNQELHSENGYLTVKEGTTRVSLTTVMNNGFVTIEEGPVSNNRIRFRLVDIGRISFSRDLPVHDLVREWTLVDSRTLESRLDMESEIWSWPRRGARTLWTSILRNHLQLCSWLSCSPPKRTTKVLWSWSSTHSSIFLVIMTLTHGMQEHTVITYTRIFP